MIMMKQREVKQTSKRSSKQQEESKANTEAKNEYSGHNGIILEAHRTISSHYLQYSITYRERENKWERKRGRG